MSPKNPSDALLEALMSPFSAQDFYWQKLEEMVDMARWHKVLSKTALLGRLDDLLGLEWHLKLEVISPLPAVVIAHLTLHSTVRSGIGEGSNLQEAEVAALSQAALAFGMAHEELTVPSEWHPLDWKPETPLTDPAPTTEMDLQPQDEKLKAHQHIDELIDQLRELGLGLESAKIMKNFKGYGETLEESRQLYRALKELKRAAL
ncbi:MAG: hypothetical protein U0Z75_07220 [Deinococcaceae bacterium]